MQTIEFRLVEVAFPTGTRTTVLPHVGGTPLTDLVRRVEPARAPGGPSAADGHAGLDAAEVAWPSRHFLGTPVLDFTPASDGSEDDEAPSEDVGPSTVLLGCTCGDHACSPLAARVEVEEDAVVWSDFRHGFRTRGYEDLWPLVFDRARYERALRATGR